GCGAGELSLLAGEIVGPSGLVVGIDGSAEAIRKAERRATETGKCLWVRFAAAELGEFRPSQTFDALIGRLDLCQLPAPDGTLRRLSGWLRPGGIVAFHEVSTASIEDEAGPLDPYERWMMDVPRLPAMHVAPVGISS